MTTLPCLALYCTVLYCTVLYCTILLCSIDGMMVFHAGITIILILGSWIFDSRILDSWFLICCVVKLVMMMILHTSCSIQSLICASHDNLNFCLCVYFYLYLCFYLCFCLYLYLCPWLMSYICRWRLISLCEFILKIEELNSNCESFEFGFGFGFGFNFRFLDIPVKIT